MAVAMRRGGVGVRAIARLLDVNPATVSCWTLAGGWRLAVF